VVHTYLGYNICTTDEQLMGIALLTKEIVRKSGSVIDFAYYISEAISCSVNNDVDHINAEVLNSLEKRIKISI
jgi:hypothetical protein